MAVTAGGTPYVESTDLVANYPATSLSLANKVDTKVDYALPVNDQTGTTYTFVLADGLRLTTASNAAASTYTVPPQASVVWLDNSVIRLVNYGAGVVTVAGGSGVTVTNAATTLAQFESVALIRTGSDAWTLVPFSGGVSNADFSDAATGTYTDGSGIDYKFITYNSSGTLTCTVAGVADILVVAGGAGGGNSQGGGGGGGGVIAQSVFLDVDTYTVTIGGGGAAGTSGASGSNGTFSALGRNVSIFGGGGGGSATTRSGNSTAATSGGGSGPFNALNPDLIGTSQGQKGGNGASDVCGGGGGAGGVGGNAVASTSSGNGGAGVSSSLNNTAQGYGGGGGGGATTGTAGTGTDGGGNGGATGVAGVAGSANRGGGGGGGGDAAAGGNGGSGVVIVRVRTN